MVKIFFNFISVNLTAFPHVHLYLSREGVFIWWLPSSVLKKQDGPSVASVTVSHYIPKRSKLPKKFTNRLIVISAMKIQNKKKLPTVIQVKKKKIPLIIQVKKNASKRNVEIFWLNPTLNRSRNITAFLVVHSFFTWITSFWWHFSESVFFYISSNCRPVVVFEQCNSKSDRSYLMQICQTDPKDIQRRVSFFMWSRVNPKD